MPKSSIDRSTPSGLEAGERPLEVVDVLHEHALGQLQAEVPGSHSGAVQDVSDQPGDVGCQHLANREVDRDRQLASTPDAVADALPRRPGPDMPARALVAPMGTMRPVSSAREMKSCGRDQTVIRVVPAHQCLGADHRSRGEVDHGLVLHDELATLERAVQRRSGGQASLRLEPQRLVEHLDATPAAFLGAVHRRVRVAQQALRGGVLVGDGDAEAGRDVHLLGPDVPALAQCVEDAFGDLFGLERPRRRRRR